MIQLTRLNNQLLVVNSELVKFIERSPDTVLTLVTGEKVVVRESIEVILQKIVEFRRRIAARTAPEIAREDEAPSEDAEPKKGPV